MDHPEPVQLSTTTIESDTVRVSIRVSQSVEEAWLALWDPVRLSKWFGELDQPWLVGRTAQIGFGDGDFFVVTAIDIVEGKLLEFEWSFLGVGPVERIRWMVNAVPTGAEIQVADHDPDRTPAETEQMVAGWTDFFQRLARWLATGESSRYEWREEIDGSVGLPAGSFVPLAPDALYQWLPIVGDTSLPHWFSVVDGAETKRFRVADWNLRPGRELTFSVAIPNASDSTSCMVTVDQVGPGSRLRFSHTGWRKLGLPDSQSLALRRRFTATWTAALAQARELAATAAVRHG